MIGTKTYSAICPSPGSRTPSFCRTRQNITSVRMNVMILIPTAIKYNTINGPETRERERALCKGGDHVTNCTACSFFKEIISVLLSHLQKCKTRHSSKNFFSIIFVRFYAFGDGFWGMLFFGGGVFCMCFFPEIQFLSLFCSCQLISTQRRHSKIE